MCNKNFVYTANTNAQSISNNSVINFGSVVRAFGNEIGVSNGNIVAKSKGFYEGIATIDIVGTVDGSLTLTVYDNILPVTGATVTITTTANGTYQVTIPFATRNKCCAEHTVTVVSTGAAANVTLASIIFKKL